MRRMGKLLRTMVIAVKAVSWTAAGDIPPPLSLPGSRPGHFVLPLHATFGRELRTKFKKTGGVVTPGQGGGFAFRRCRRREPSRRAGRRHGRSPARSARGRGKPPGGQKRRRGAPSP